MHQPLPVLVVLSIQFLFLYQVPLEFRLVKHEWLLQYPKDVGYEILPSCPTCEA